jgi:hypothetical protein
MDVYQENKFTYEARFYFYSSLMITFVTAIHCVIKKKITFEAISEGSFYFILFAFNDHICGFDKFCHQEHKSLLKQSFSFF